MPSSISSFDPGTVTRKHASLILLGLLAGLLLILALENVLRLKGAEPNVKDTAELWASERARASALGKDALILVGSSRIQLDLDLALLEEMTGLKPVQLAIDGSPYLEVLEHLADDPEVTGTILISTTLLKLVPGKYNRRVNDWISTYDTEYRGLWSPRFEQRLTAGLQSVSTLYANSLPIEELIKRLVKQGDMPKIFLKTYPSRERDADYSLVRMPDYYLMRVQRNLGHTVPPSAYVSIEAYREAILGITRDNYRKFSIDPSKYRRIRMAVESLQGRGAKVVISRFPQSGLIEEMTEIRYPKQLWQSVVNDFDAYIIDYRDFPELHFELPDGSHLDKTQKPAFTREFSRILVETIDE